MEEELENMSKPSSNLLASMNKGLKIMLTLSESWSKATISQRKRLQKLVFPRGAFFDREKEAFRTTGVNTFFALSKLLSQNLAKKRGDNR